MNKRLTYLSFPAILALVFVLGACKNTNDQYIRNNLPDPKQPEEISTPQPEVLLDAEEVYSREKPVMHEYTSLEKKSIPMQVSGVRHINSFYIQEQAFDFNTEEYSRFHENKFHDSLDEPVSTFSIDVDTASYANVRRFLNNSSLPPEDSVRIEEMINYFDYSYPAPEGNAPFSINLDSIECPWNEEHKLVRIGLQGKEMDTTTVPPGNLVFLLDVSGSMNSANKLPLLKKAFNILVQKLRASDRVAIVVYAGAAGMVLDSTSGTSKAKILSALNALNAGGSTAGGRGIELAYKIAQENFIQDGNNRIILATDGDFNVGESSTGALVRLIEEKRKSGIYLSILGFGMGNYKDSRMEELSNSGNGNYAYIDNILEAKKVLGTEIWSTLYSIAKDVKIQVEFNPAQVASYRLIGYENRMLEREDFNDDAKDAGEIGAGHRVTALYEIIPAGQEEKANNVSPLKYQSSMLVESSELFTLKIRYKRPEEDKSILLEQTATEETLTGHTPSEDLFFAAAVAEFGMILRRSEFKQNASFENVLQLAKLGEGSDEYGYRAEFIQLVRKAEALFNNPQ